MAERHALPEDAAHLFSCPEVPHKPGEKYAGARTGPDSQSMFDKSRTMRS